MFSNKPVAAMILVVLFIFLVGAQAAEPTGKAMMPPGSIGLADPGAAMRNESSISNSSMSKISMNNSSINNTSMSKMPINSSSVNEKAVNMSAPAVSVIDLSGYSKALKNKNLTGYRNIMYPMGESRGPPGGVAGGGSCGCSG